LTNEPISNREVREDFWLEAITLHGSVTPKIIPLVMAFGLIACGICGMTWLIEWLFQVRLGLEIAPFEIAGVALGLLLVLRTNAGYERWWEGRKLWGAIVNQSRNFVISALSYGPKNSEWQEMIVRWTALYPHVARLSLRGEHTSLKVANLVGSEAANAIAKADHMPIFVALKIADLLRDARDNEAMDGFAFIQVDRERALLIDHIGACERILKTPLPRVYSIKIRRFISLFLITLPLVLLHRLNSDWLVPLMTMLVAYPLLCLDQIGIELENPFSTGNLSHPPLDELSATIERNLLAMLKVKQTAMLVEKANGA
jgi:putative membrane protein